MCVSMFMVMAMAMVPCVVRMVRMILIVMVCCSYGYDYYIARMFVCMGYGLLMVLVIAALRRAM
jgi:hypothetical protein